MGKCPFKHSATIWALIPTTLVIFSYNLEEVENSGNHVLVSGENRRNPPGNHKRRGYCCFWSIFKVICHFHMAAILDFGERENGNQFFSESLYIKNIRLKVKLLLKDKSHGKYTVSCTISRAYSPANRCKNCAKCGEDLEFRTNEAFIM